MFCVWTLDSWLIFLIFFFLLACYLDPEGDFVEVLGRNFSAAEAAKVVIDHIRDWDGFLDRSPRRRGGLNEKPKDGTGLIPTPVPAGVQVNRSSVVQS